MKLDRSRDFAETIGGGEARYHQDGRDFDIDGNLIGEVPKESTQQAPKRRGRPPKESAE